MKDLFEKIKDSDAGPIGKFFLYLCVFAIAFIIDMIIALPIMYLWNWVVPDIFGLPEVTWLKMWGITLLCDILFKMKIE